MVKYTDSASPTRAKASQSPVSGRGLDRRPRRDHLDVAVLLVFSTGARIFFAMARDGLLPQWAAKISPIAGA